MQKIMFNDKYGLTQAVLEGRKTQTRRIAYTAGRLRNITVRQAFEEVNKGKACLFDEGKPLAQSAYKLGEIIAIAQKYEDLTFDIDFFRLRSKKGIILGRIMFEKGCFNKMFVRAALMPHHIRITNISVERLQDISNGGCLKEGIWRDDNVGFEGPTYWYHGLANSSFRTPQEAYASLIDRISGKGTLESNPYPRPVRTSVRRASRWAWRRAATPEAPSYGVWRMPWRCFARSISCRRTWRHW